jgi:hypothetical protein
MEGVAEMNHGVDGCHDEKFCHGHYDRQNVSKTLKGKSVMNLINSKLKPQLQFPTTGHVGGVLKFLMLESGFVDL